MNRYFSNTAFIDLLFNIVVGIAFLFIIAFLLINPVSKKNDVKSKADYLIMLHWDKESIHDIDLWIKDPEDNILSFKHKDIGFMHLDRDDLGRKNDKIKFPNGEVKIIKNNEETAALRGTVPGQYIVNVHVYRKKAEFDEESDKWINEELPVTVTLIKVNPYDEVLRKELIFVKEGEEKTAFRFSLDENGEIVNFDEVEIKIVNVRAERSVYSGTGGF